VIVVAGTITVRPERREEAIRMARAMAQATRAEAGCVAYDFYADLTDPGTFFVFEVWESDAALTRHFQTEHMAAFQREIPQLVAGPTNVRRYVVETVTSM
jgi:quinol monooxygenase YgiN